MARSYAAGIGPGLRWPVSTAVSGRQSRDDTNGDELDLVLNAANDQSFQQPPNPPLPQSNEQVDWPVDFDLPTSDNVGQPISCDQPSQRRDSVAFPGQAQFSPVQQTGSSEDDNPTLECDEENGRPRFYGPTSQLHIRSNSLPVDPEPETTASSTGNGLKTDSSRVKEVLIQGFWESQPLSQAIIERTRFEEGRKAGMRSEYWSPLGYLYCGMATRMIFDLGLHGSCSALVAQGRLTLADKVSRHVLFLGAYVYDTLWGLYLGRPSSIPVSMLKAAQSRGDDLNWSTPISLEAWVGLGTEIAEATEVLNNNAVPLASSAMDHLADLDARISRRLEQLPSTLTFDADQISELAVEAYGLQIQLRGIRIVLHKRLSQTMIANNAGSTMPESPSLSHSRTVMHDSAVMIARLTSTYQRIFGIENVITVMLDNMFVAAALLVTYVLNLQRTDSSQSTESDIMWLHCLSDMLQRAQKHYPVTARMLSTLSTLVHGTSMAGIFGESPQAKQISAPADASTNNLLAGTDWSVGLGFEANNHDGQQDSSTWFLDGSGETTTTSVAPMMDPRNMMTWLLSPMEL
ncbi:hypothetical protein PRZ48_007950 [Zasmidium cellare]|uniref:Xylanolytic transcriptional activator regulatory domain-containing protein n=1 Tax=Zasmidium cellare TaxID=395010 RepID=A0ABR0EE33_ZASCE|nr:hypothetical protein PRZ48_007950 [Zasmidium cellare]